MRGQDSQQTLDELQRLRYDLHVETYGVPPAPRKVALPAPTRYEQLQAAAKLARVEAQIGELERRMSRPRPSGVSYGSRRRIPLSDIGDAELEELIARDEVALAKTQDTRARSRLESRLQLWRLEQLKRQALAKVAEWAWRRPIRLSQPVDEEGEIWIPLWDCPYDSEAVLVKAIEHGDVPPQILEVLVDQLGVIIEEEASAARPAPSPPEVDDVVSAVAPEAVEQIQTAASKHPGGAPRRFEDPAKRALVREMIEYYDREKRHGQKTTQSKARDYVVDRHTTAEPLADPAVQWLKRLEKATVGELFREYPEWLVDHPGQR